MGYKEFLQCNFSVALKTSISQVGPLRNFGQFDMSCCDENRVSYFKDAKKKIVFTCKAMFVGSIRALHFEMISCGVNLPQDYYYDRLSGIYLKYWPLSI